MGAPCIQCLGAPLAQTAVAGLIADGAVFFGQPLASLHLSMVRMGAPMMTVGGAPIRSQIGNWFDIRWCASLGVATGIARILPVVRAEAAPCLQSTPGAVSARLAIGIPALHCRWPEWRPAPSPIRRPPLAPVVCQPVQGYSRCSHWPHANGQSGGARRGFDRCLRSLPT